MTISEVEELTGMTRANIRYYEEQGFILPERAENGYRDYSQKDVDTLKKIKLLRTLHMSLEEIKSIHNKEQNLIHALDKHIDVLSDKQSNIELSRSVCKNMREDFVSYETFDAQKYLDKLAKAFDLPVEELECDTIRDDNYYMPSPIRRFFARTLDLSIYRIISACFLSIVGVDLSAMTRQQELWESLIAFALLILMEPFLLSMFGTTIGKAILSIHVKKMSGRELTHSEAFWRMVQVLVFGMGLSIPIINIICLVYSFIKSTNGDELYWEGLSDIYVKDDSMKRYIGYIFAHLVLFALLALSMYIHLVLYC